MDAPGDVIRWRSDLGGFPSRHLRHRSHRRGAGAPLQGARHDGRGLRVDATRGRRLRPDAFAWRVSGSRAVTRFFVLLVPYAEDTHRLIGAREFAAMKPSAYFVNLARGGIVDEEALMAALERDEIAGAAI